jgi:hypothetical protein
MAERVDHRHVAAVDDQPPLRIASGLAFICGVVGLGFVFDVPLAGYGLASICVVWLIFSFVADQRRSPQRLLGPVRPPRRPLTPRRSSGPFFRIPGPGAGGNSDPPFVREPKRFRPGGRTSAAAVDEPRDEPVLMVAGSGSDRRLDA